MSVKPGQLDPQMLVPHPNDPQELYEPHELYPNDPQEVDEPQELYPYEPQELHDTPYFEGLL